SAPEGATISASVRVPSAKRRSSGDNTGGFNSSSRADTARPAAPLRATRMRNGQGIRSNTSSGGRTAWALLMRRSAPGESRLGADNQSCVVGELTTQSLRTGDLGCPAGVVELGQPQVVQPRSPQSNP